MAEILVLYYSRKGSTAALAREVCRGVDAVDGMAARLRTVPNVSTEIEAVAAAVPDAGPPYATGKDLRECAGLVMGSPTNFGNMAASLKHFLDGTVGDWFSGILIDKPAGVFTSSASLHGGQESTLLTMALPLIHHGMLFVGLPYAEERLSTTTTGGTPYGASHVSRNNKTVKLSDDEKHLAMALGKRVATFAARLEQKEQ